MALTKILHLVFILSSSFLSLASSLLFQSLQSASPVYEINIPYYVPEGLAYHEATDRIIIPSLATGAIRSFPNTNQLDSISEQGSTLLYSGSFNGTNTPIVGIKVYGDTLYGAVGAIPPLSGPFYGGLLILDLQSSSSNVQLVDFSPLYGGTLMTPNDVVYSSYANAIFVTDFYGYRVFKYDLATSAVSVILTGGVLCSICSTSGIAYDGPNGIATKDNYLLVARSGTLALGSTPAIVKVPIDTPSAATIVSISPQQTSTESILDGADGLIFDANNEILYLTNNGKDLVVAIRSKFGSDAWSSGQVVFSFTTRCQYKDPSTSTIIPQTGDLLTICTELFGEGPYELKRLAGVANNYGAAKAFSYDLTNPFMIPESLTYQPSTDTLLYSSFGLGEIFSTLNPTHPVSSGYSVNDGTMKKVLNNGALAQISPVNLLGILVEPVYDHLVWSAYNAADGKGGGILRCNTMTGSCDISVNLDVEVNGKYPAFYNDISIDPIDGTVYSADTGGHKIEATRPNDRSASTSDNGVTTRLITSNLCIDCSSTCGFDGAGTCGPNGIALLSNGKKSASALITGVYSTIASGNGFFRVDIAEGTQTRLTVVPDTFVDNLDGMRFDDEEEFLFVAGFGTDAVSAYFSCDDWKSTMYLAGVFQGGCSDGTNTAVTYTSAGDLVITCVDGFGGGPYPSTRITNIRSRLLGISYSSVDDFCDGEEPFDLDDDNESDGDGDEDDDAEEETVLIVLIVLTCLMGSIAVAYALLYHVRGTSATEKKGTELTSVQNVMRP